MARLAKTTAAALILVLSLLVTSASPSLAVTPGATSFGSVGICRYEQVVPGESYLRRLAVKRPTDIGAVNPGQTYGWRFIVLRKTPSGTKVAYRSGIQKRVADSSGKLAFRRMGVAVDAPYYSTYYYLRVRVYRFASDGSVQWSAVRDIDHYRRFIDGNFWYGTSDPCWGHGWHNPV